jgi:GNAT superfamily N-acetyltransferase
MTERFILWRCLHYGALSPRTIDRCPSNSEIDWKRYRSRNIPLLVKLTRNYGACAILARAGSRVVGQLRFYPKIILDRGGAEGFCLLQDFPYGPADDFGDEEFPGLEQLEDKTLAVHCLMTGSSLRKDNPFQRKGIGSRMVQFLIQWAKAKGWERIEADAFEDIPIIYEITGSAGITFWQKLGFHIVYRLPHPYLEGHNEFVEKLEKQAESIGISKEQAKDRIIMRLDLT